jgi:threonine synthase
MNFFSTKDKTHKTSFVKAMINGLAPNEALYFPEEIPSFSPAFFNNIKTMSLQEVAKLVITPYIKNEFTDTQIDNIIANVFNFDIPLVNIEDNIFALELFHGPTLAFKDVGARFLANSMQYVSKNDTIRVLVATSGDTGSAVANGFLGVKNTEVVVLYPKGKVSELQQKQFTTLGENIKPIAIDGTFDDCQRLVKSAFTDNSLKDKMNLTSANSINVARWIPQSIYYYWAYAQVKEDNKDVVITVPSGNLGNITAGLLAKKTGLPVKHFIASSNSNNIIPEFLKTGVYSPKPSIATIANAMDVGDPNNFPRLIELYNNNYNDIKSDISGYSYSDNEIRQIIRKCYANTSYLLDPHGATGYAATKEYCNSNQIGVFLETAHPGKFQEEVEKTINQSFNLPERLEAFVKREAIFDELPSDYNTFKEYLLNLK